MAALTNAPSLISRQVLSGEVLLVYKVEGDAGGGTTFEAALRTVRSHWICNITETQASQTLNVSYSGNTITYGSAPTSGDYHFLYLMGWP